MYVLGVLVYTDGWGGGRKEGRYPCVYMCMCGGGGEGGVCA